MGSELDLLERFQSGINTQSSEEAQLRERVTSSFGIFSAEVAGRKDKPFHQDLNTILDRKTNGMILLPRGWGKSTKIVDYCCYRLAKQRDIRIIIATNALRLGIEWLREIENILQYHAKYREIFGNLVPNPRTLTWNDTEKIVLGRSPTATHTSLYALSVGGSTLGKRADLILVDDIIEPEKGVPSLLELHKINEWFWKVLYPVLEPEGVIFVFGTRFSQFDLYGQLLEKRWPHLIIPALGEDGESTFPERFPTSVLLERKGNMGSILFNLQYQNLVTTDKSFKEEWLKVATDIPSELEIYQGVDPSLTADSTSDFFSEFTIGISGNKIYLLDLVHMKLSLSGQLEVIKQQAAKWKPRMIAIETNAAQILIQNVLEGQTLLPIKGIPSKSSKTTRLLPVAALFESGRIEIKGENVNGQPVMDVRFNPFVEEWLTFPNGKHDDTLDSLEKAISLVSFGPPAASGEMEVPSETYGSNPITGQTRMPRMFGQTPYQLFFARQGQPGRLRSAEEKDSLTVLGKPRRREEAQEHA